MKQDTRKHFFKSLIKKAQKNKKILFLTGDLGYNFYEEFRDLFPERCINMGIAEQNMIGVATGLKLTGWEPYCYSNAIFINYKCLEQIRSAALQGIKLNIVGTGAADFLGFSHNFQPGEHEPLKDMKNVNYIRL